LSASFFRCGLAFSSGFDYLFSSRLLENSPFILRQCFGKLSRALRTNGGIIETIDFYPFVVSLSNHSKHFFNSLLAGIE